MAPVIKVAESISVLHMARFIWMYDPNHHGVLFTKKRVPTFNLRHFLIF